MMFEPLPGCERCDGKGSYLTTIVGAELPLYIDRCPCTDRAEEVA
jgi:hypothetical protein